MEIFSYVKYQHCIVQLYRNVSVAFTGKVKLVANMLAIYLGRARKLYGRKSRGEASGIVICGLSLST